MNTWNDKSQLKVWILSDENIGQIKNCIFKHNQSDI